MDLSDKEILKFAVENGIININNIQAQIEMNEQKKYLEMHNYKKWKGTDGNWHTYLPDEEKGRVHKKRKSEEDINQVIIEYYKEQSENPTIEEVFTEWNDRRLSLKKISPSSHIRNKQYFDRHYKEFGKKRIKNISSEDIVDFLEEQIPKYNLTAKAFSNLKGITKGFLKRAKKRKLISFNVEETFDELDVSDTEFKKVIKEDYEEVFDEDEMQVVMDYLADNLDIKNIGITLMFVTGIRVGELVALKHSDFDENSLKIRRTETRYPNDDKSIPQKDIYEVKEYPKSEAGVRTVVIPKDYMWICTKMKSINPFGEYIFVDSKGKRMTTNCIRRRLERICKTLNVYRKSPHKIRKTYGTILLDNNVDNKLIECQMGHTDIICTERHYHRNRRSIENKVEVLSSIPDFSRNDSQVIKSYQNKS